MYRQGDLLIVKITAIPANAKPQENKVLAYGEATGHKHELGVGAEIFELGGEKFFTVKEKTALNHNEHDTIEIPEGTYRVIRQREYDEGEIRRVED